MSKFLRLLVAGAVLAPGAAAFAGSPSPAGEVRLSVLSGRADLVTGGSALVEAVLPQGASGLTATVDGRDVSRAFTTHTARGVRGLVTGLHLGANALRVQLADGRGARLTLVDHSTDGPLFSGRQVQPWICSTEASGLGRSRGAACNAPTRYFWSYKSTNPAKNGLQAFDPAAPPTDVASTTTDQGATVPYIVRDERGTLNRTVYDIALLWDPSKPAGHQRGWNAKLGYTFGGGCAPSHLQTNNSAAVLDDLYLKRGFAVASAGLNVLGNDCNEVVSAETVTMVKETVVKHYGPIRYTIGNGCSGGSIQQNVIANQYPGLLDGIQPACTYPDSWTTGIEVYDCTLLLAYLNTSALFPPGDPQRSAVLGQQSESTCRAWHDAFAFDTATGNPSVGCEGLVLGPQLPSYKPPSYAFSPTNPHGARCTKQDYEAAVVGLRPDGKAKSGFDNTGVQYGLRALQSGLITTTQFLDLNRKIGGLDVDFGPIAARSVADPGVSRTLYRSGRINDARGLRNVPIIDLRGSDSYEIHTDYNSYVLRERLKRSNGTAGNYVMFTAQTPLVLPPSVTEEALVLMDRWLAGIERDHRALSLAQKVLQDKPAEAVDSCYVGTRKVTDSSVCRTAFPYYSSPRIAAGGPLTNDVAQCQLQPLNRLSYAVSFTDAEWASLHAAFPHGVCDFRKRGVGQQYADGTWHSFSDGPGGRALAPAPTSLAFG